MLNFTKKRKIVVLLFAVFMLISSVSAFATTVGDQLALTAETGWQRIENTDSHFLYSPTGWPIASYAHYSGGSSTYTTAIGSSISFNFTGDKIRLIFARHTSPVTAEINIDGVTTNVSFGSSTTAQPRTLVFENLVLSGTEHFCVITSTDIPIGTYFDFDAIEIAQNAEIKSYNNTVIIAPNSPSDLSVAAGDGQVDLSWTAITGATGYKVYRSTTPGGPYTTPIAENVTGTSYPDSTAENGITYYYVVSSVSNGVESPKSNEVSATPTAAEVTGNAIISITMTNGNVKEYELSKTEVTDFINWYDGRVTGSGEAYYIFNKDYNLGPYQTRDEYIISDAISSFEIQQY